MAIKLFYRSLSPRSQGYLPPLSKIKLLQLEQLEPALRKIEADAEAAMAGQFDEVIEDFHKRLDR